MTEKSRFPRDADAAKRAKEARKRMSRGADHLWYDDLRKRPLRFRRMETIGRVSVDFFCSKALLAIDVLPDGSFDGAGLEEKRRYLRGFGIVLICYEEEQVLRGWASCSRPLRPAQTHRPHPSAAADAAPAPLKGSLCISFK